MIYLVTDGDSEGLYGVICAVDGTDPAKDIRTYHKLNAAFLRRYEAHRSKFTETSPLMPEKIRKLSSAALERWFKTKEFKAYKETCDAWRQRRRDHDALFKETFPDLKGFLEQKGHKLLPFTLRNVV